ncbi:hypothetical protein GF312_11120 [Candidatus Poribacteria bacterium]|nr:hypothetical protein [Candidatus Poribacteria bacterium]
MSINTRITNTAYAISYTWDAIRFKLLKGLITFLNKSFRVDGSHFVMWKILMMALALLLSFWFLSQGSTTQLGLFIGAAWMFFLFYRYPMPAIFALMILSTNVLMFIDMKHLPYWQLGPGLRLNMRDSLLTAMFVISIIKLYIRREYPLFIKQVLLIALMVMTSFILGLLLGITDLDVGMNCFRSMFTYAFYFVVVANVDSPKRLRTLIYLLLVILIASVGLQIIEAVMGTRLTLGLVSETHYDTLATINVEGEDVPYLWSRATLYVYITFFMLLGVMMSGAKVYKLLPFILLAMLGFIIELTRTWYLLIAVGVLAMFAIQRGNRFRIVVIFAVIGIGVLATVSMIGSFTSSNYGGSLLDVWVSRLFMISHKASTFVGRTQVWQEQLGHFWESPMFGYGMSEEFLQMWNIDTGLINTLLQFGFIGLLTIIVLIISVLHKGYKLWKKLGSSIPAGYVAGIIGAWTGMILGYSFNMDFFTMQNGIWCAALLMAIMDRIEAFYTVNSNQ